jgi:hypothetical protein
MSVGSKRTPSLRERVPGNASVEPTESEYYTRSEVTHNDRRYDTAGMQGPYTVCKELPTKGGSKTARPPNIDRKSEGDEMRDLT